MEGTDVTDLVRAGGGLDAIEHVRGKHGLLDGKAVPPHELATRSTTLDTSFMA